MHNHVKIGAYVIQKASTTMSVNAQELDIMERTAQLVSEIFLGGLIQIPSILCISLFTRSIRYCYYKYFPTPSAAEFLTWIKISLKPAPNTVHYFLTHYKGVWNVINKITFVRNAIMSYVLTCKLK